MYIITEYRSDKQNNLFLLQLKLQYYQQRRVYIEIAFDL